MFKRLIRDVGVVSLECCLVLSRHEWVVSSWRESDSFVTWRLISDSFVTWRLIRDVRHINHSYERSVWTMYVPHVTNESSRMSDSFVTWSLIRDVRHINHSHTNHSDEMWDTTHSQLIRATRSWLIHKTHSWQIYMHDVRHMSHSYEGHISFVTHS